MLHVIPIELADANQVIEAWHRHHQPCVGHRFSLGCVDDKGVIHGAAVVGRPVARLAGHPSQVLEVTRLVSDGTKNVCSMLYSAAARSGREMGFLKIQTYILADEETGVSLKASGWICEGVAGGGQWKHTDRKPRREDQPTGKKMRWVKQLNRGKPLLGALPTVTNQTDDLFEHLTSPAHTVQFATLSSHTTIGPCLMHRPPVPGGCDPVQ